MPCHAPALARLSVPPSRLCKMPPHKQHPPPRPPVMGESPSYLLGVEVAIAVAVGDGDDVQVFVRTGLRGGQPLQRPVQLALARALRLQEEGAEPAAGLARAPTPAPQDPNPWGCPTSTGFKTPSCPRFHRRRCPAQGCSAPILPSLAQHCPSTRCQPPATVPCDAHYGPRLLAVVRAPAVAHLVAVVDPLRLLLLQALAVVDAAGAEAVVGVVDLLLLCKDTDQRGLSTTGQPRGWRCPRGAPAPAEQLAPPGATCSRCCRTPHCPPRSPQTSPPALGPLLPLPPHWAELSLQHWERLLGFFTTH